MGRILVFDAGLAGVSGDMVVGALVDLGADKERILKVVKTVERTCFNCKIKASIGKVLRLGIRATRFEIEVEGEKAMKTGGEVIRKTEQCIQKLNLSVKARNFSLNTIKALIEGEAKVHGKEINEVHLHETGSVDTLVDVLCTATALEDLNLIRGVKKIVLPVAVGGGCFKSVHGVLCSPAPATVEILKNGKLFFKGGPIMEELATPTGAAILSSLADMSTVYIPALKIRETGYGAGRKDFSEIPNVLRVFYGDLVSEDKFLEDEAFMVETNVDDVTGELIGYIVDKLMVEGAKDVTVVPALTKKSRPVHIIRVLTDRERLNRFVDILIRETGSLGVRIGKYRRKLAKRKIVPVEIEIDGFKWKLNIKVSMDAKGEIINVKPEYEDVKLLAEQTHRPFKEIFTLAMMEAKKKVGLDSP